MRASGADCNLIWGREGGEGRSPFAALWRLTKRAGAVLLVLFCLLYAAFANGQATGGAGLVIKTTISAAQNDSVAQNNQASVALTSILEGEACVGPLQLISTVMSVNSDELVTNNVANVGLFCDQVISEQLFMITKRAGRPTYTIAENQVWTITATNLTDRDLTGVKIHDRLPGGITYLTGTARVQVNGTSISTADPEGVGQGLDLVWDGLSVPANADVQITFQTQIGAGLDIGAYYNRAVVTSASDAVISEVAFGHFNIVPEAVFDCADVIGRVFNDKNADGYPSNNEPGLSNIRLLSTTGTRIVTDRFGRFSVPCADIPEIRRGSNYVLKLDPASLPVGFRITSENPRVVRLTRGKVTKLNFGAAIQSLVRLDLSDDAFIPADLALSPQWDAGMKLLVEQAIQQNSVLRITYRTGLNAGSKLAEQRLRALVKRLKSDLKAQGKSIIIEQEIIARVNAASAPNLTRPERRGRALQRDPLHRGPQ